FLPKSCEPLGRNNLSIDDGYNFAVSASEIIKELPKLSEAERRAIREGLLEIANQDGDVALCNQAALEGALMLDGMEDEDARRQYGGSLEDRFRDGRQSTACAAPERRRR